MARPAGASITAAELKQSRGSLVIDVRRNERWREGRLSTKFIAEEFPEGFHPQAPDGARAQTLAAVAAAIPMMVGIGTFLPVKTEDLSEHRMYAEWGEVDAGVALRLNADKRIGRYSIVVHVYEGVTAEVKTLVVPEGGATLDLMPALFNVKAGTLDLRDIDEETISQSLYTAGMPDPDLLIRTAGEMRVSNYLLWQISYAELFVSDVLWPDFGAAELHDAIREFSRRNRRFGALDHTNTLAKS